MYSGFLVSAFLVNVIVRFVGSETVSPSSQAPTEKSNFTTTPSPVLIQDENYVDDFYPYPAFLNPYFNRWHNNHEADQIVIYRDIHHYHPYHRSTRKPRNDRPRPTKKPGTNKNIERKRNPEQRNHRSQLSWLNRANRRRVGYPGRRTNKGQRNKITASERTRTGNIYRTVKNRQSNFRPAFQKFQNRRSAPVYIRRNVPSRSAKTIKSKI